MRLLLIDTGIQQLDLLTAACKRHSIERVPADSLDGQAEDGQYEAILVAGVMNGGGAWERPDFLKLVELVRLTNKPMLAAGTGFELVLYAVGYQLHEQAELVAAGPKLQPTSAGNGVFQGGDPMPLNLAQRWTADDLPKDLVVLARSETGVEAVKYKTRPVYGLQLLPEDFKYSSDASLVYANIVDSLAR